MSKSFVAVVPINSLGQVLVGRRTEDGVYTTPGGGVDSGELPEDAAVREAYEEANLRIDKQRLKLFSVESTPRGFPIYKYLYLTDQLDIHTKNDPDKECKSYMWMQTKDFPEQMRSEKNKTRLDTINEAIMNHLGLIKALNKKLKDKIPGGLADKKKPSDFDSKALAQGIKVEMEHTSDKSIATEIAMDHLTEDPKYYDKLATIEKGGPGSGQKGHQTNKEEVTSKLKGHLDTLKNGTVLERVKTKSEKPVFLDMEHATAHGYTPEDHADAMNHHYDLAEKMSSKINQLETLGHKLPEEAHKIKDFHMKQAKKHLNAGQKLKERMESTESAIKDKKDSVNKSITQMGHHESSDLNTGNFAVSLDSAEQHSPELLNHLYAVMADFQYGDSPRDIGLRKGSLHLVKVEEGLYTGYFICTDPDGLEDTAKIRIERITIPDLVQLIVAKEWDKSQQPTKEEAPTEEEIVELTLTEPGPEVYESVMSKLNTDQKIQYLDLMHKLLN